MIKFRTIHRRIIGFSIVSQIIPVLAAIASTGEQHSVLYAYGMGWMFNIVILAFLGFCALLIWCFQ